MTITNDWKSNIGNYLAGKGAYRTDLIKKQLDQHCKEYLEYLGSFNGISTHRDYSRALESDDVFYTRVLTIHLDKIENGNIRNAPFVIGFLINDDGTFLIKYSTRFNWNKNLKMILSSGKEDTVKCYEFKEEVLDEPERFEKEWLFQIINQRLMDYIDGFTNTINH
jgi:hypothetical protein